MTEISSLSVSTLNVNESNFPIKRQRSAKWIFKKSMIQLYFVY